MAAGKEPEWTAIYETPSPINADLVRTTLEVAGYRVWVQGGTTPGVFTPGIDTSSALTVSVPADDAEDARDYLEHKTSLLPHDPAPATSDGETAAPQESLEDVAQEILELRRQHEVAACKYCGIATLDVGEIELDSRMIASCARQGSASTAPLSASSSPASEFARTAPVMRLRAKCAAACSMPFLTKVSIARRRTMKPMCVLRAAVALRTSSRATGTGDWNG